MAGINVSFDAINTASGNIALVAATSTSVEAANTEVNGLAIQADPANTTPVYLFLGTTAASATNWHRALPAGAVWNGDVGGATYRGPVQAFSTAAARIGVTSV